MLSCIEASQSALSLDNAPSFIDLLALPRSLTQDVFARVPVDTRLRCTEVNKAWRALLADTRFWTSLDVSLSSGCVRFSEALFRVAVAKAGGQLLRLDVTGLQSYGRSHLSHVALLAAINANTSLIELRVGGRRLLDTHVKSTIALLPCLTSFEASVSVSSIGEARAMLRNVFPFGALRLSGLGVLREGEDAPVNSVADFAADVAAHATLERLVLRRVPLGSARALQSVVDAAAVRVTSLWLSACGCNPASVPLLTKLIAVGRIRRLRIDDSEHSLFPAADDDDTRLFCATVRKSAMTRLELTGLVRNAAVADAAHFINTQRN